MKDGKFGIRMTSAAVLAALLVLVAVPAGAHQGAKPISFDQRVQSVAAIAQLVVPPTDVQSELARDAGAPPPLRFAVANLVQATPATHGTWETVPNGRLWRLRVGSAGATDLNFAFTNFWLPKGAMLWVVAESEPYYEGPYTAEHNQDYRQLWTPMVPGESAVIELFVPSR